MGTHSFGPAVCSLLQEDLPPAGGRAGGAACRQLWGWGCDSGRRCSNCTRVLGAVDNLLAAQACHSLSGCPHGCLMSIPDHKWCAKGSWRRQTQKAVKLQ